MTQLLDDLIAARALIDAPEKWTQGVYARDADGEELGFCDDSSVCFCVEGAIYTAINRGHSSAVDTAMAALMSMSPCIQNLAQWNDAPDRTHADVMQRFDRAIAKARAAG